MIEIRAINNNDIKNLKINNEPFDIVGTINISRIDNKWSHKINYYDKSSIYTMTFPNEIYTENELNDIIFIGAFDDDKCVGLAVLTNSPFKYIYLSDLKVNNECRHQQIGSKLITKCKEIANEKGYSGIYTICQDNNVGAFLFYLKSGFIIGGYDDKIYNHTSQENKGDIILYCESK